MLPTDNHQKVKNICTFYFMVDYPPFFASSVNNFLQFQANALMSGLELSAIVEISKRYQNNVIKIRHGCVSLWKICFLEHFEPIPST